MSGLAVGESAVANLSLPMSAVFGLVAGGVYLVSCFRHRHGAFTILDTMIVISIMAVVTAVTMPVLDAADESARSVTLQENLRILKQQIELYKLEHGGSPPLFFKGRFPQLSYATNSKGVPGPRGPQFPYGPYLPAGLPINPYTGSSVVEPTETFPPARATGTGGWLYYRPTGQIAPQLPERVHWRAH